MTIPALRAIIFDFNGVIADDEPTHFLAFQQALAEDGVALTKEEYYGTYLGMDERTCAGALLEAITGRRDPGRVQRIAERKAVLFASLRETTADRVRASGYADRESLCGRGLRRGRCDRKTGPCHLSPGPGPPQ